MADWKYSRLLICFFVVVFTLIVRAQHNDIQMSEGKASYYGSEFHGRNTASGDIFDNNDLTAAHRRLPFNTYLNVVNMKNGKNVIVRVNDRGPYVNGRIVDLSLSAATHIDSRGAGVVPVQVRVLNYLKYNPEMDSLYSRFRVVALNGKPVQAADDSTKALRGYYISCWSSFDLIHVLYVASDMYLKSEKREVYIGNEVVNGRRRFHVLMGSSGNRDADQSIMTKAKKEGFFLASYFDAGVN